MLSPADIDRSKQRAQSYTSAPPQFQSPLQFPRDRQERFTPPTTVNLDPIERADNSGVPPTVLFGDFTPDQAHFPISPSPRDPNPPFTISPHLPAFVYVKDKPVPLSNSTPHQTRSLCLHLRLPHQRPSQNRDYRCHSAVSSQSLVTKPLRPNQSTSPTPTPTPTHKCQSNPTRSLLDRRSTPPKTWHLLL